MKSVIEEIHNWLNCEDCSDKEKVESIAKMLFIELSDEQKLDLFYDSGDDFDFYMKFIDEIDFSVYDGECGRDMLQLITKKVRKTI